MPTRYRGVFTCAPSDHAFYEQHDTTRQCQLTPVGCAVDAGAYRAPPGVRESTRAELGIADDETLFIFSGSSFQPNVDALAWLNIRTEAV